MPDHGYEPQGPGYSGLKNFCLIDLITDGPGQSILHFFDRIVEGAGYRIWPKNLGLPRDFAMMLGFLSEMMAVVARSVKRYKPKMNRFAVIYTCTDFTFNSEKAKRDFGFGPKYCIPKK